MRHGSKREQLMPTFTTRWLNSVRVSEQTDFVDRSEPGLMFRVAPSGVKSWSLLYRRQGDNKRRRVKLGRFPEIGLAAARAKATRLKEAIAEGADPATPPFEVEAVETVDQLLNRYLKDSPPASAKWSSEVARIFKKDIRPVIGGRKLTTIKRADILAIINRVKDRGAGVSSNRTLAAIRKAFNWAVEEGHIEANPAAGISRKAKEEARDRALSEGEIRAFWTGLDDAPMTAGIMLALRLALATGQRIGEVVGAPPSEIDFDKAEWLIPTERSKNGREHLVPLSPLAVELFREAMAISADDQFIFPNRARRDHLEVNAISHAMRGSLRQLGLDENPATPHDLRRTVASQLAAIGIAEATIARVLNHISEVGKTITGKAYIRHGFTDEKRAALERWAAELERIIVRQRR
jgi:integrase